MARKKRRSGAIAFLNGLMTLLIVGVLVAAGAVYWGVTQYYKEGTKTEETAFLVEKGSGFNSIGQRLEERGLIENSLLFRAGVWATKRDAKVLPGQYLIPA